ncbi:MAG TPA: His-Xaa-Ser system protein HxsD [Candidatus Tumulicola sp.]|jgi:His-Xaa-Ser system protein HxsD
MGEGKVPDEGACPSRVVRFSLELFDAETIKKAAYRFTDRCAFDFSVENNFLLCEIRLNPSVARADADKLEALLRNDVLEQSLRKTIREETAPLRNAILAYVFSETGLQSGE